MVTRLMNIRIIYPMNTNFRSGRISIALRHSEEMPQKGLEQITIIYNTMLYGLYGAGRDSDARQVLDKMSGGGVPQDIDSYHIILDRLSKNECIDEALDLFQSISCPKYEVNIKIFTIFIDGMFRAGRPQTSKDLFHSILSHDLVTNVVTQAIMMNGLIKGGLLDDVDDMFFSMDKFGCSSNSIMLNVVVRSLSEEGNVKKAKKFLHKMKDNKFSLEASIVSMLSKDGGYRSLMNALLDFSKNDESSIFTNAAPKL